MTKSEFKEILQRHVGKLSYKEALLSNFMFKEKFGWIEIVRAINSIRELKELIK